MTYHEQYKNLVNSTITTTPIENERTSQLIYRHKHSIVLVHDELNIPIVGGRYAYLKSAAAECAWYLSGTKNCEWLNTQTSMWKPWQENNEVNAGYGFRWRNGIDQINAAIENLTIDKTTRRVWVSTWDANEDTILSKKSVPCPVGFYLDIDNNCLNISIVMRSSDIAVGLVYDTISFRLLQNAIATTLKLSTGCMEFILINAHIYESQYNVMQTIINESLLNKYITIPLPNFSIDEIIKDPDNYVKVLTANQHLIDLPKIKMAVSI